MFHYPVINIPFDVLYYIHLYVFANRIIFNQGFDETTHCHAELCRSISFSLNSLKPMNKITMAIINSKND